MALDRNGNAVITTTTRSRDIPVTPGAFQRQYGGGLAIDADDNVYVVGTSRSRDFPTTPGVVQPHAAGDYDAVIVKLKSDGSGLVWSTFLGGSDIDGILGVRVDAVGNVYFTGHTESTDFPVTDEAAQPRHGGRQNEFSEHRLTLLDDGSQLVTGVTSSPDFPASDGAFQSALPGKRAGFVARLTPDGRRFAFATFLGASREGSLFMPSLDPAGNIYLAGHTTSTDFPVTSDALRRNYGGEDDGVFAILSRDGTKLLYGSYFGGSGPDMFRSLALGENGAVYLIGSTASDDIPITPGAVEPTRRGGSDGYVVKLAPNDRGNAE